MTQDNNALAQELDTIIDQAIGDAEDHITMSFDTAEAILAALRTAGEVGHKRDHGPSCCCAHCQLDAWKDEQSERQATVGQEVARIVSLSDERGDFVTGLDGCVIWWPDDLKQGGLNAWHLCSLADELDRRNADWFAQMAAAFPLTTQPAPASGEVVDPEAVIRDQFDDRKASPALKEAVAVYRASQPTQHPGSFFTPTKGTTMTSNHIADARALIHEAYHRGLALPKAWADAASAFLEATKPPLCPRCGHTTDSEIHAFGCKEITP